MHRWSVRDMNEEKPEDRYIDMLIRTGRALFSHQPVPYDVIEFWEAHRTADEAAGNAWQPPPPRIILP